MIRELTNQRVRASRRYRRDAGQSLTVAIIVLFLLLFLGGLFVALVVNNLRSTGRKSELSASEKFAMGGLEYLDKQLTESPEGADWRPVPDNITNTNDPDYEWLKPCALAAGPDDPCGYTRVTYGGPTPSQGNLGGRALVKIIYNPNPAGTPAANRSATSKFLKLLSIGRAGVVDPNDPTTYQNSDAKGLRSERVGYKALGLVENLLHVTNKNDRPATAVLGAVQKVMSAPYGDATTRPNPAAPAAAPQAIMPESAWFGPIHFNAPMTFAGINRIFLDASRGDAVTVAAPLQLSDVPDSTTAPAPGDPTQVTVTETVSNTTFSVLPSASASFSTFNGLVRDNFPRAATSDRNLRNVAKTTAPQIDLAIGEGGLTRYRALTQGSELMDPKFTVANPVNTSLGDVYPGQIGWGANLYLNNREDLQQVSDAILGGYSLRGDWLNPTPERPGSSWKSDWRYVPPAVTIEFTPRYIKITRSNQTATRSYLRDNNGQRINQTTIIRYSGRGDGSADTAPAAGLPPTMRKYEGYPAEPIAGQPNVYTGDYVIYAEGNVRVRGTVGGMDPETQRYYIRHLTVVSNGTIYIDGSVLKDNIPGNLGGAAGFVRGKSSVALLAKQYVAVNTTQFLAPSDQISKSEDASNASTVTLGPDAPNFNFKLNQGPVEQYQASGAVYPETDPRHRQVPPYTPRLLLRHAAAGVDGSTAIHVAVNASYYLFPAAIAWPNANPANSTLALGGPTAAEPGVFFDSAFDLKDAANPALLYPDITAPYAAAASFGMDNLLAIQFDQSAGVPNQTNYRLSRVGIVPNDIRIEALIYAQEGSFFIIPGPWFNPDQNDTYENYIANLRRSGDNLALGGLGRINPLFPFYGEPLDIRITLYGAITENLPAEIGDQAAWLEKWGWVPHYYGSTGLPSAPGYAAQGATQTSVHGANGALPGPKPNGNGGGTGIVYIYDDKLVAPYDAAGNPLRTDAYGNVLPVAPRLPVAPGLLFVGENPHS